MPISYCTFNNNERNFFQLNGKEISMNVLLDDRENWLNISLVERREKLEEKYFSGSERPHWPTSKSMQVKPVKLPHEINLITKKLHIASSQCTTKTGVGF